MEKKEFELIIIGGGPAGVSAGVYAARKKIKTLVIAKDFGGQSVVSDTIENWIGEIEIKGSELKRKLEEHIKYYRSDDFVINEFKEVKNIKKINESLFEVEDNLGEKFISKAVLVATGSARRKLKIEGADKFEHKGLTYCASCDGPLFAGKDLLVVGGGNAGFESASQLLAYANSVTLMEHSDKYKAEATTVEKILSNPKMIGLLNVEIREIYGNDFVEGVKYFDKNDNELKDLKVQGVFVEIGAIPATSFISDELVDKNDFGQIKIDHRNGRSSEKGIWAAGDCTDSWFKQNAVAMGDAVKAIEDIYIYLNS